MASFSSPSSPSSPCSSPGIIGLVNADAGAGVAAKPSLGLGPGAQHHRLLPDLDSRISLFTYSPGRRVCASSSSDYKGTVRSEGFHWANPFYSRSMGSNSATEDAVAGCRGQADSREQGIETAAKRPTDLSTKVSVRARTLNGDILKRSTTSSGSPIKNRQRGRVAWPIPPRPSSTWTASVGSSGGSADLNGAPPRSEHLCLRPRRGQLGLHEFHHAAQLVSRSRPPPSSTAHRRSAWRRLRRRHRRPRALRLALCEIAGDAPPPAGRSRHRRTQEIVEALSQLVEVKHGQAQPAHSTRIELDEGRKAQMASNLHGGGALRRIRSAPIVNAGSTGTFRGRITTVERQSR